MTVLHKKQIVLGALIVMVGVAGYLNWRYEASTQAPTSVSMSDEEEKGENIGEATLVSNSDNDFFLQCRKRMVHLLN